MKLDSITLVVAASTAFAAGAYASGVDVDVCKGAPCGRCDAWDVRLLAADGSMNVFNSYPAK